MTNILLVCSVGMSVSMTVRKMQEAAAKKKIEAEIWAVDDAGTVNDVEEADVMFLGPQVRFLESKMKVIAEGKPVAVIGMQAYDTTDGTKVLEQVLKLLGM